MQVVHLSTFVVIVLQFAIKPSPTRVLPKYKCASFVLSFILFTGIGKCSLCNVGLTFGTGAD